MSASFTLNTLNCPINSSVTLTVTGSGTSWTSGTTFSASGVSGVSVMTNSVNAGAQTASITVTVGVNTGLVTIADSTDSATAFFAAINAWAEPYDSNTDSDFAATSDLPGAGWTDAQGAGVVWTATGGVISAKPTHTNTGSYDLLGRPTNESTPDQRMLVTIPSSANSSSHQAVLRWNGLTGAGSTFYSFYFSGGTANIYRVLSGSAGAIASGTAAGPAYNSAHAYQLDASAVGGALWLLVYDTTASAIVASVTVTDTNILSGGQALTKSGTSGTTYQEFSRVQCYSMKLVPVSDAGFSFSPFNWYVNGSSYAATNQCGADFAFNFTGSSCSLLTNLSTSSGDLYVSVSIDDGPWIDTNLNVTGVTVPILLIGGGLTNTLHKITVFHRARLKSVDSWGSSGVLPTNSLTVTGMMISGNGVTSAPTQRPNAVLAYGASQAEGANNLGPTSNYIVATTQDSKVAFPQFLADALNAKVGVVAFGGIDIAGIGGQTNVPTIFEISTTSSWDHLFFGQSRLSGGLFSPQPTHIVLANLGDNGGAILSATYAANAAAWLPLLRAAAPSAWILVPHGDFAGQQAAAWDSAFATYQAATPDAKCKQYSYGLTADQITAVNGSLSGGSFMAIDGKHLSAAYGAPHLSASMVAGIVGALNSGSVSVFGSSIIRGAT